MTESLIPITFFISVFGIVAVTLYFNTRREQFRQETIRSAISQGQELTEEIVKSLAPPRNRHLGLAAGLPCIGLGLGLLVFGFGINETEVAWASAFPFFLGLGFILYWQIQKKNG